ncbi:DUF1987 domain-containing protein [Candidatus Kapaibacterium sp.]
MNNLIIEGTKSTPSINFDYNTGHLSIAGESFPENFSLFYEVIINWLDKYISESKPIQFDFRFVYFNTSSSKAILDIIEKLDNYHKSGGDVVLNWYYEIDDEDIYESGLEFTENLTLKCDLIEYNG